MREGFCITYCPDYIEAELEYRNVLILDESDSIIRSDFIFPKKSLEPLSMADLCFYVMPNGGIKCLKDRYDSYVRDTIYFGQ